LEQVFIVKFLRSTYCIFCAL